MAKKQQPKLSYGPNMGLIAGEAAVAASEAGLSNVGQSFVTGATSMFAAIKQANAERDAKMEAYESEISGLLNLNQFEDPKNKQVIKNFLNTQREEYINLSRIYDQTKDREVKDKMEEIKFSLVNLNDQIQVFNQDKIEYRTASDEKQLASLKTYDRTGDDFFTNAFTNNAAFSIDERGDIIFGINNNSYKYRDKAGKWESNTNIDESNVLTLFANSYSDGSQGKAFNSGNVRRALYSSFKNTGNNALKVFVTTDLTSDNSSLSFEEQFASGKLKEKHPEMYVGFTPTGKDKDGFDTYDTDWMFENKNGDLLRNKVSDYFTKVVEDGHGQGRTDNYTPPPSPPKTFFLGKQNIPEAAVTPDVNILNEDPKDIPARTAWNNTIFRKVDGQYQIYQDDAFADVTKEQLRVTLDFSEKVGYDMSSASTTSKITAPEVPADFDAAFRDDEKKVVQYFKNNPNLYPEMEVKRTTSDDPEDGNDTFRITMPSGISKVFTADPLVGDENKIQDAWDWINSNYENNEFAE
tara:strand:+ start:705 stop:2270 length:1566 start_codon:yes stop_codon:yes gene_type:complete